MAFVPKSLQEAWGHHYEAFSKLNVDQIMVDYDDHSIVRRFNNTDSTLEVCKGQAEIRAFFERFFEELKGDPPMGSPAMSVDETTDVRQVFLCFNIPSIGYATGFDNVVYNKNYKVDRHHIVITRDYKPKSMQAAWDNHFAAFGAQNLYQIMLDYDDKSVVKVFNNADNSLATFTGLAEIRGMFSNLFADLKPHLDALTVFHQIVEEDVKQVFLVWNCGAAGYLTAADTFVFDGDHKIRMQDIVITKK